VTWVQFVAMSIKYHTRSLSTEHHTTALLLLCSYLCTCRVVAQMIQRFRKQEKDMLATGTRAVRQLVVAVTANAAQGEHSGELGFDEVCPKPLNKNDIYYIINKYLNSGAQ
jgi:CheY-like chemotaxis protein